MTQPRGPVSPLPEDDHPRSRQMYAEMAAKGWIQRGERELTIANQGYRILDGNVTTIDNPIASVSTVLSNREIIVLDPQSPALQNIYQSLKQELLPQHTATAQGIPIENVLKKVMTTVKNNLHGVATKPLSEIAAEVESFRTSSAHPKHKNVSVIPLDEFIRRGIGVCRHYALLTFYLISELIKDRILPPGSVYHHRDAVPNLANPSEADAHIWCIYKPDQDPSPKQTFYLVDSTTQSVCNVLDWRFSLTEAEAGYGKEAIVRCINRYNQPGGSDITVDIERARYKDLDRNLQLDFMNVLMHASPERALKILYCQQGLMSLNEVKEALGKYSATHRNYPQAVAVLKEIAHIEQPSQLLTQQYIDIKDPNEQKRFVLDTLYKRNEAPALEVQSELSLAYLRQALRSARQEEVEAFYGAPETRTIVRKMTVASAKIQADLKKLFTILQDIIENGELNISMGGTKFTINTDKKIKVPDHVAEIYKAIKALSVGGSFELAELPKLLEKFTAVCKAATDAGAKTWKRSQNTQDIYDLIKNNSKEPQKIFDALKVKFPQHDPDAPTARLRFG